MSGGLPALMPLAAAVAKRASAFSFAGPDGTKSRPIEHTSTSDASSLVVWPAALSCWPQLRRRPGDSPTATIAAAPRRALAPTLRFGVAQTWCHERSFPRWLVGCRRAEAPAVVRDLESLVNLDSGKAMRAGSEGRCFLVARLREVGPRSSHVGRTVSGE